MKELSLQKIMLLIGLSIMGVIINIDYTAVNLALVTIAKQMNASLDTIQWVLSGYILAWAAIVIPAGKCADVFGQRNVCAFGLGLFIVSSVFAGMSTSTTMIIASRVLQGISGAIFIPTLYALIFSNFAENKRGMAIGIFSLGVGTGAAIGPSFGGFFLKTFGWPWIFYINVPITLLAMLLIFMSTPKDNVNATNKNFFQRGTAYLGASIVVLMYTINLLNHYSFFSMKILPLFLISAALFGLYVLSERKTDNPVIPMSLLKNTRYKGITISIAVEQFCFSACYVALGLYMQNTLHFTAFYASVIFLALSIVFAIISTAGGFIVDKVGIQRPAIIGFVIMAISSYWFALLPSHTNMPQLLSMLATFGIGMGLAFAALNTGMVKVVSPSDVGIASSVFIMFALIGNALGVVVTTLLVLSHGVSTSASFGALMALIGAGIAALMLAPAVQEQHQQ